MTEQLALSTSDTYTLEALPCHQLQGRSDTQYDTALLMKRREAKRSKETEYIGRDRTQEYHCHCVGDCAQEFQSGLFVLSCLTRDAAICTQQGSLTKELTVTVTVLYGHVSCLVC